MRRQVFPTAPSPTVTHLMNFVPVAVGALLLALVVLFISLIKKTKKLLKKNRIFWVSMKVKMEKNSRNLLRKCCSYSILVRDKRREQEKAKQRFYKSLFWQESNEGGFILSCQRGKKYFFYFFFNWISEIIFNHKLLKF